MLLLYGLTVFGSALLLFFIQPMFARIVLPLLGGTPAVWTTTQVFCEGVLLAGYLYAHASTRWLSIRSQILVHTTIMVFALLILPIRVPSGWVPPAEANPIVWLLALLAVSIGLPFFVISGSSPLLQRWFTHLSHRESQDPYFLYGASNMGSLAALFAYPAVAEPWLRLGEQTWAWAFGYCLLIILTASCAFYLWKAKTPSISGMPDPVPGAGKTFCVDARVNCSASSRPALARRFRWLLLAFVPCSLMLSVTTYLTTDIASVPLLWVIPLGIYLLTFILVFARREVIPHRIMLRLMPLLVLPLAVALAGRGTDPIVVAIPMHLAALFVISMVCHGELAKDRPSVSHLTEFYVYLSAGGFLGGIFNALIAPAVFNSVAEYPIVLAISCTLLPWGSHELWKARSRLLDVTLPLILAVATAFLVYEVQKMHLESVPLERAMMFGIPAIVCFSFSRRPLRFALAVAGILWAGNFYRGEEGRTLFAERSFFGVSRVTVDDSGKLHQFRNGTTLHGSQRIDPAYRRSAMNYYCRTGPLGQFFEAFQNSGGFRNIALIGLGVGGITSYAQPGQKWTYYEIDPAVVRIARDTRYFSYLHDCPAAIEVILGDGRLKLESARDSSYDVLILDAYSSDSVPVHLIDSEALKLYRRKIKPHGKLVFHISNRYLDLEPVLGNLARDAGLYALAQSDDTFDPKEVNNDKKPSAYVVLGSAKEDLTPLTLDPRWAPARTKPDLGVWTDDFSSVLKVMRWNMPVTLRGKAY